jgi:predicted TIM-barrel fold metal-dependent hydrolase
MNLKTDCHVHMIGNGSGGSGCSIRLHGTGRLFAGYMAKKLGLPLAALRGNLEECYIATLKQLVAESSLDAVFLLASDHVRDNRGEILARFDRLVVPNDCVLAIARKNPELLPAVSIHPARPDAIDELERCADLGARVMKCLPNYHNIDCSEEAYRPFWETMKKRGMVLLAHTGGELSLPNTLKRARDPRMLEFPLQCGVTVVAAHCGTKALPWERDYLENFLEMLERYPNLYGDNSALTAPNRVYALNRLARSPWRDRIVHGSDLPIPVVARWAGYMRAIPRSRAKEIDACPNPLERDFQVKLAAGFPPSSFELMSRLTGIGRLPAQ